MKKLLMFFFIILFLFSSCSQVPEQVRNNTLQNEDINDNALKTVALEKDNINNIAQSVDSILKSNYGALKLPTNIYVPHQSVYEIGFNYTRDFTSNMKSVAELFFDDVDSKKFVVHSTNIGDWVSYGDLENDGFLLSVDFDGFIGLLRNENKTWDDCINSEIIKQINPQFVYEEQNYSLDGEEVSISSQIEYINIFLNESYKMLDSDFDFRITDVYVRKTESGRNVLEFNAARIFNNVDITSRYMFTNEEISSRKKGMSMRIFVEKPYEICAFQLGEGIFKVVEQKEIEKIVTLDCALKLVQNKLTGNSTFELSSVNLEYELIDNNDENAKVELNSKLIWKFKFACKEQELINSSYGKRIYRNKVREIEVDALTGEVDDSNFSITSNYLY